jgi:hypothetical protein
VASGTAHRGAPMETSDSLLELIGHTPLVVLVALGLFLATALHIRARKPHWCTGRQAPSSMQGHDDVWPTQHKPGSGRSR